MRKDSMKPKTNHPWKIAMENGDKLKTARAAATRRRQIRWHKEDELSHLRARNKYRAKVGIPLEAPPMKPWDYAKGKVGKYEKGQR